MDPSRVAVVTGAAGALGRAVAAALAPAHRVVAVDRDATALETLAFDCRREVADVGDPADVDALFRRLDEAEGALDVLVHTVGTFRAGSVADSSEADYRLLLEVNLHPAWWVSRAAAIRMRTAGRGAIVHVGARQAVQPAAGAAAYAVSKAALVQLTRVLDAELRPAGVRVNAILPALIDTPANRAVMSAAELAHAVQPAAIARVVSFLVSDDAAPVVGALIPVYGAG